VPKYVKKDVDKFIGDISYPVKKNKHVLMEEALLRGDDVAAIVREYGWMRARDGFSEPFTAEEIEDERRRVQGAGQSKVEVDIEIPEPLRDIAAQVQELVYFRTLRTDIFYEFLFLARPLLREVAASYGLSFMDLRKYAIWDLISGELVEYPLNATAACYRGDLAFFDELVVSDKKVESRDINGVAAYKGRVQGVVKIVKVVDELDKVEEGDVLVTQMTAPSFVMAMRKAAAFVTDEGGLTCHAAIVARELKKPCVIGTKIATQVLKDGDMVEVDAEKGVVKVIKRRGEVEEGSS